MCQNFRKSALLLVILVNTVTTSMAQAVSIDAGLIAVEEGDDRLRLGVSSSLYWNDEHFTRFYFWGRKKGPVTDRAVLLSHAWFMDLYRVFGFENVFASLGPTLLLESIRIDVPGEAVVEEYGVNVGAHLGLQYQILFSDSLEFNAFVDSHLFPAGLAALFLSSGRKLALGFSLGVRF